MATATLEEHPDPRDWMVDLAPIIDCARRLGLDPAMALRPISSTGPVSFLETFDAIVARPDFSLAAFGWSVEETIEGPRYRLEF